jgi:hypothetical protein
MAFRKTKDPGSPARREPAINPRRIIRRRRIIGQ